MYRKVILLTNSVAPDKLGGLERYVSDLGSHLSGSCDVTIVAKRVPVAADAAGAEDEIGTTPDGVRIVRYDVPSKTDPSFAVRYPFAVSRAITSVLRHGDKNTIIHAHFPVPALVPALRRVPFVYTFHAPVFKELLSERQGSYRLPVWAQMSAVAGLRASERLVLKRASLVITLSDFMRGEALDLVGAESTPVEVIAGGIRSDVFHPGSTAAFEGKAAREDFPLLFAARRHVPRTGVLELIQAMQQIAISFPNAHLVLAGDGPLRGDVELAIRSRGLSDRVTVLGRISDDDLVNWYRRADLAITPTQELEGFGLSTAEAMACGTPALVTPVGANAEVATRLSSTLVCTDRSPRAIADCVVRACRDRAGLLRLRSQARQAVVPDFSWENIANRHLEIYESQ